MGANFHLLTHKKQQKGGIGVPKGCLAIKVGQTNGEQKRFIIPVVYFNHPLFRILLKEAEREYGFDQKGTIIIPCNVEEFRHIQGLIDQENRGLGNDHQDHGHHLNPLVACFRT